MLAYCHSTYELLECQGTASRSFGLEVNILGESSVPKLVTAIRWIGESLDLPDRARFVVMTLPVEARLDELREIAESATIAGLIGRLCLVCDPAIPMAETGAELQRLRIPVVLDRVGPSLRLADLTDYPLDGVELDRQLIDQAVGDPRAASVLDALVHLAKNLGLRTFARTSQQAVFDHLSGVGVDYITLLNPTAWSGCPSANACPL